MSLKRYSIYSISQIHSCKGRSNHQKIIAFNTYLNRFRRWITCDTKTLPFFTIYSWNHNTLIPLPRRKSKIVTGMNFSIGSKQFTNHQDNQEIGNIAEMEEAQSLLRELFLRKDQRDSIVTLYQRKVRLSNTSSYDNNKGKNSSQKIHSTNKIATQFCNVYSSLPPVSSATTLPFSGEEKGSLLRIRLINVLANEYAVNEDSLLSVVRLFIDKSNQKHANKTAPKLIHEIRDASTPSYEGFFQLVLAEADWKCGMRFIVEFRTDLLVYLDILRNRKGNMSELKDNEIWKQCKQMDSDLKSLLSMWFSSGLLGMYFCQIFLI